MHFQNYGHTPVVLLGGAAKEVWWEIADMPVLTSMPEVAQAWRAWLADSVWNTECNVGSVLCLMQILVNRHHMTFTFLHAKLLGEFVKDHGPIAEIRQIFYEEPKYAPTHLLASTLL